MMYESLKIIHIISAAILFGTGLGSAFYVWYAHRQKDIHLIAKVFKQSILGNLMFSIGSAILLAITGFIMLGLKSYHMDSIWVVGSIIGYFIMVLCWLPALFSQIHCHALIDKAINHDQVLTKEYAVTFLKWKIFTIMALVTILIIFYLMTGLKYHLA